MVKFKKRLTRGLGVRGRWRSPVAQQRSPALAAFKI
jgi:hypothetical protein